MKQPLFILSLLSISIIAHAESTLEKNVRCSKNPRSYSDCSPSSSRSSSYDSYQAPSRSEEGMNTLERAYCAETKSCGPGATVDIPRSSTPSPQAQRQTASPQTVPAYLLPPKRDDNALRAMHAEISGRIATLESYIQGRQYGASAELAQQLIVYAQEQVGFDAEVQLQEKVRVQPGALSWPTQQRNDAMAIALKQYRGGLYVQLLNMYKRVKLMWTVANYNMLKQRGSIKPGARETLRNEMLSAYMVPIIFVDQAQPQAYVLTFDFMLVNPVANFHYNAELEIVADSLKELGFTSETFVEQAKSLALSKIVISAQQAPVQQAATTANTAIQPGQDLSSVLIARENEKQAAVVPGIIQDWARSKRYSSYTTYVIKSQSEKYNGGYFNSYRMEIIAEAALADGSVCKFDISVGITTSGATNRKVLSTDPREQYARGYCY